MIFSNAWQVDWGIVSVETGGTSVTLPLGFTVMCIGLTSRVTRGYTQAMANECIAFPNHNLTWITLYSGSTTTETMHYVVLGF